MNNYFKAFIWIFLTLLLSTLFCNMLTAASTISNILAVIFVATWIYISYSTCCFTNIILKKNEKSN